MSDPKDPASVARAIAERCWARAGPPARPGTPAGQSVHMGGDGRRPPSTCTARPPSVGGIGGNEDSRYRRRRIHRIAYLRPAARARARSRGSRRADPAGTPKRARLHT